MDKPSQCDACRRRVPLYKVVENMMGMDIWFCASCKAESERETDKELKKELNKK